jgi:hypothetical protein
VVGNRGFFLRAVFVFSGRGGFCFFLVFLIRGKRNKCEGRPRRSLAWGVFCRKQCVGIRRADFALSDVELLQVLCFRRVKIASKTEILVEEINGRTGAGFT